MSLLTKKKKNIGVQVLHGLIFHHHQRRRRWERRLIILLISAILGCLLLLRFAAMSFLFPHLTIDNKSNNVFEAHTNVLRENVFHVPFVGGSGSLSNDIMWTSNNSNFYYGCSNSSHDFSNAEKKTVPDRYLLIETSGGLNQERTGIIDAVVAAYILNATLVVPKLDDNSFWKDASNFAEIFDMDWFITYLSKDVKIIKQLPKEVRAVLHKHVPRKCDEKCYETNILPIFNKKSVQAVELKKFDFRLSNILGVDLQKLRCRVNYHALKFTDPILEMGHKLVERMRNKSKHFIALHLRFEPDMLGFSSCYYGGGEKEINELSAIRKRWKNLRPKDPVRERKNGKCVLSPEEVGLMMRALGYGDDVHIFLASGEVYGSEKTIAPLKALFPNLHTKETIASKEELTEFSSYSSRMAALDFIVSDESDVFVTNNNGNMAKILAGRRRYFGHKPTIRPHAKKLQHLFLNRSNTTWEEFASSVQKFQIGFMGVPDEVKPGKDEVLSEDDDQDLPESEYVEDGDRTRREVLPSTNELEENFADN